MRRQHDIHKEYIGGVVPKPHRHIMDTELTDFYVIDPTITDRRVLYALQKKVVFFRDIDEDAF